MARPKRFRPLIIGLLLTGVLSPLPLKAADPIEAAGIGIGLTAGNALFVPVKSISVFWGLTSGALSFVLSGGNADLTAQIWNDVTQGPYMITPQVARMAVGERPELQGK
jgi:hypothetical protein